MENDLNIEDFKQKYLKKKDLKINAMDMNIPQMIWRVCRERGGDDGGIRELGSDKREMVEMVVVRGCSEVANIEGGGAASMVEVMVAIRDVGGYIVIFEGRVYFEINLEIK
ncbi:hypothetical protein LguiA_013568 [Lonicera macranthoides]